MWTHYLSAVIVGVIAISTVQGQTTAPQEDDRGIIMGMDPYWISDSKTDLEHLHSFPGTDANDKPDSTTFSLDDPNYWITSIDADFRSSNVYMYDVYYGALLIGANYSAVNNNLKFEYKVLRQLLSQTDVQVAYDWLSHTLYWCDPNIKAIIATSGEWQKADDNNVKIIAFDHLEYPDGITLDPIEGYLFWSDNGVHPKIERAHLDGSKRHTIVSTNLSSPVALEADIFSKRLFWIDTVTDSIVSADYDGGHIDLVTRLSGVNLQDIAVFRDVLYLTDRWNDEMITIDKITGEERADSLNYGETYETPYSLAVYTDETQPLKDKDYCAEMNCEHMCVSEKYGASCLCWDGYILNTITQKCDMHTGAFHKAFVYANASHICLTDIQSMMGISHFEPVCRFTMIQQNDVGSALRRKKRQVTNDTTTEQPTTILPPTVAPEDSIKMIEVDGKDRFVFIVSQDDRIFSRFIDLPIEDDQKNELAKGSEISGLGFDSEDSNLFWSQLDGSIYAVNVNSRSVVGLTDDSPLNNPKDLIVLTHTRKLAFITGEPDSMSIQTMNMDGTNIMSILDDSRTISSLIFDKDGNRFYYLSTGGGIIYYVDLDNPGEAEYKSSSPDSSTYILLEYHNYFIWLYESDDEPNLLETVEKSSTYSTVGEFRFDNVSGVVDIAILDADRQAMKPGLCSSANGQCAHICVSKLVYGNAEKVCECKKGFKLASDKKNCTSDPFDDDFIIILDWDNDEIFQVHVETLELRAIPTQRNYYYISIYLDPDTLRLYWADNWNNEVLSSNLDGSDARTVTEIIYAFPYKYEMDSSTGNLYYISSYYVHVGVVTPDGVNLWLTDEFRVASLLSIALHPANGHIYVGILDDDVAYVARFDMDGKNMVELIKGDHVKQPDGLAIDFINDHLYVSDIIDDTVIRCNLDGQDCLTIVNMTNMQITDIVVDETHVYYTSFIKDYVVRVDKHPPYNHIRIGENLGLGKITSISYYSSKNKNKQAVGNACLDNNGLGDCSTICLPTPNGRTCACEIDVKLHPDGRTCENVHLCRAVIPHTNPVNNETVEVKFPASCLRREDTTCNYKCPSNYVPVDETDTMLTCKLYGWDRETHVLCKEHRCAPTFENGAVEAGCSRNIGGVCGFTCKEGFMKTKTDIFCREDQQWHGLDENAVCVPYKCDTSIRYGKLDTTCARTIGSTCSFTCNKFYDYKSMATRQIMCGEDGWDMNTTTLCSDAMCDDSSLMNGMVVTGCVNHVGRSCPYKCNGLFTNSTKEVVCRFDQKWHPEQACRTLVCPMKIEHGILDKKCSPKVNSVCRYHCDEFYTPLIKLGNITCLPSGQWNASRDLCSEPRVTPSPLSGDDDEPSSGFIVGIIILAIVVLILIVAMVSLYKKNKASSSAFKNDGNISVENPGYRGTSMSSIDVNIDRPYSGDQNQ